MVAKENVWSAPTNNKPLLKPHPPRTSTTRLPALTKSPTSQADVAAQADVSAPTKSQHEVQTPHRYNFPTSLRQDFRTALPDARTTNFHNFQSAESCPNEEDVVYATHRIGRIYIQPPPSNSNRDSEFYWKQLYSLSPNEVYRLAERDRSWMTKVCPYQANCKLPYCVRIHGEFEPNQQKIYDAAFAKHGTDGGWGYVACRDYLLSGKCTRGLKCTFRHFLSWSPLSDNQIVAILASFFFNYMAIANAASELRHGNPNADLTLNSEPLIRVAPANRSVVHAPNYDPAFQRARMGRKHFDPSRAALSAERTPRLDRGLVHEHRLAIEQMQPAQAVPDHDHERKSTDSISQFTPSGPYNFSSVGENHQDVPTSQEIVVNTTFPGLTQPKLSH